MKRVAVYLRVSTDKQTTDNQRRELEAVAARSGWHVVKVYEDAGISGAKGRDKRPGLDAMLKAVNAREFDMVAAWSVDRLGRSLKNLLGILQSLRDKGVDLLPCRFWCSCTKRGLPGHGSLSKRCTGAQLGAYARLQREAAA
jgi:DNA invertase Pin-like site-specific DNA recombinase